MKPFSFRQKVLIAAVTLVTVIQLGTLLPVLRTIERDAEAQARRSVDLAGVVFDEFMLNRTAQLLTTVDAVTADFAFREAVALGEPESVLANHSARAGAAVAMVFDLDGNVIARAGAPIRSRLGDALPKLTYAAEDTPHHAVMVLDGAPFQTVTVPVRAPVPIAWAMFGFPIDQRLAADIENLTGLHASFVRFGVNNVEVFASTLSAQARDSALAGIHLGHAGDRSRSAGGDEFLTALRPFQSEPIELYVALQQSMHDATASYRSVRNILLLITGISMLLAIGGAFWIARLVTRPVQDLAAAARRMREGVYSQSLDVTSSDELGDLAAGFNSMQEAIADRERHIFHIAHHDSLSALPTRDLVVSQLREKLADRAQLSVINLALSRFDGIVSSLGHRTADEVIKLVAGVLRDFVKEDQIVGHLNQQEFVIVLPLYGSERAAEWVVRLADRLRAGVLVKGANISLQARAGIASYPDHSQEAAELLRCAAIACNEAQQSGAVVEYRLGQEDRAVQLTRIVGDFPRALQNDEMELYFQPRIDCATREVVGAEALVRWRHPELGLLPPDKFVGAIEQAGGIAHLTRWVLREALKCCGGWRANGLNLETAVNISVDDLVDEYLPYQMLELTKRYGLKPADVTLEVTESAIMHHIEMALAVVSCMRELGFRVAIDDFGTGQSALAQLKRMPVDELKIDKSFVMNMDNVRDEAIVRTTIELAHQFGLCVVAEGVETAQSLERLQALGCEYAQGYHIAKPLPQAEFLSWVRRWSAQQGSGLVSIVGADRDARATRVR